MLLQKKYPFYYKPVTIVYYENKIPVTDVGWLSWSEKYGYIWTLMDNETIILDKDVIKWLYE